MGPAVSFDDEPLIMVDHTDEVVGYETKSACHRGEGLLHRAFSVFVFNDNHEVLLQRRSSQKPLWPKYWANSCCSHPRKGEQQLQSVNRRLQEELGIRMHAEFVYRFRYQANYGAAGSEHELCSVYVGHHNGPVAINGNEIDDWCFMSPESLDQALSLRPERYTPWLKLEWPELRNQYWPTIKQIVQTSRERANTSF